ncbi:MAG: hypothetical protein ABSD02_02605 [Steroidobacteraceae bacterium]|jgi:hypothetical protein
MQDAFIGGWSAQASFSVEVLAPLHDLNLRFLDLVGAHAGGWRTSGALDLPGGASGRLKPMTASQRAAAAHCPYALFDLRFHDEAHWSARLQGAMQSRVADESAEEDIANFVRLALFYAWHVANSTRYAARLLLGMSERTAGAFRAMTLNCLPALVASESANLSARFLESGAYWSALVSAAVRRDEQRLRKIQLFGLQLAAAAQLP